MKAEGMFLTTIATLDVFLVAFFVGFNSRHVMVIDPNLPPYKAPAAAKVENPPAKPDKTKESAKTKGEKKTATAGEAAHPEAKGAKKEGHKPAEPTQKSDTKDKSKPESKPKTEAPGKKKSDDKKPSAKTTEKKTEAKKPPATK